jgi:hypothetical protein
MLNEVTDFAIACKAIDADHITIESVNPALVPRLSNIFPNADWPMA